MPLLEPIGQTVRVVAVDLAVRVHCDCD
jgi:hypothetical protein